MRHPRPTLEAAPNPLAFHPVIAFVLSGGASLGAIEVGMLRALYEREIAPELIVGASAGAVNGAYIASRPATVQTAESLAEVWLSLRTIVVFPPNPVTAVLGLLGQRDHLVPNDGIKALLEKHMQFERLEDASIPFHVIATDVLNGAERRLSQGDAEAAVLASAAIPGVYPAIEFEGETLVDGGVSDNTPISIAAELGATKIYVLPTGIPCTLPTPPKGALQMLVHAITLLINQRLTRDIETFSHEAELIVLPPPCPNDVLASDFSQARLLIDEGYKNARDALEQGDSTALALERMRPHPH
jgi:NTE family protein